MKISQNDLSKIDDTDRVILQELMEDARCPIQEIASKVKLTGAAVHKRIKKMEHSGLIKSSRLVINPKKLGYNTLAFVGIFLQEASKNTEAVKRLKDIPEVLECYYTTGDWSILIKILCTDNEHLMKILYTKIQSIKGVSRTETFVSLNQQIDRQLKP